MSSSAITTQVAQLKAGNIQNQADSSSIYSAGVWSFKNSIALTSVTISDAGNVGIGTGAPTGAKLEIFNNATAGHLRISTLDQGGNDSSRADIDFHVNVRDHTVARLGSYYSSSVNGGTGGLRVFTRLDGNLRSVATFSDSGGLSIGASNPVSIGPDRIQFYTGQFYVLNPSSTGVRLDSGATSWVAQSDERSKKNIKPLELGLEQIKALKPSRFDYKTDESEQSARVGFVAQEVLPVLPHAVFGEENSEQMMGVSATEMIPVLVAAIQEQQAQIESLKAEVAALKAP